MSALLDRYGYIETSWLLITWILLYSLCSAIDIRVSNDGLVVEGQETRLICKTETTSILDTLFGTRYTWRKIINGSPTTILQYPGQVKSPYDARFSVEKTDGSQPSQLTLVIDNTNRTDAGTYECEAEVGSTSRASAEVTINVIYLDLPTLTNGDLTLNENDTAIFMCSAVGNPEPRIIWLKDGSGLDVLNTAKYRVCNTLLMISKVTISDEGKYKCRAENGVLTRESRETATLKVNDLVTLSTPSTPTTGLVPLSTITPAALEWETSTGSVTVLVVGMIFLGIIIGIVLSSSVYVIVWKMKTSSKATQGTTKENQAETYMEYGGELKTENQTYQDLRKKDDQVYVNINAKKEKRTY